MVDSSQVKDTVKESKGRTLKFDATVVYQKNMESTTKIVVNQGSTRSSKTYSICQMFIVKLLREQKKILTVVRKTMPSLKTSAMRDFMEILKDWGLYDKRNHNKTESTYRLNGNLVEFVAIDQPQKKKGSKRNYLWLNEANELTLEDYVQLAIRTTERIFLDYNPSDEFHWIYDHIIPRKDCTFIRSTYKDNPFLEQAQIETIESLEVMDEELWRVYGLGLKGSSKLRIFDRWQTIDNFPEDCDIVLYGLDFGFNNPSAVIKIGIKDKINLYLDEIIYQDKLTKPELIERMKEEEIDRKLPMIADSAEPASITEIYKAGFNIMPVHKRKNGQKTFVYDSIDKVKRKNIYITKRSVNIQKEFRNYKWMVDKDERTLDQPVPFMDHAIAGIRYANIYVEDMFVEIQHVGANVPKEQSKVRVHLQPQADRSIIALVKAKVSLAVPSNSEFRGNPF